MRLSMFMGEDGIRLVVGAAGGRVRIKECRYYDLPGGTLLNDVVLNDKVMRAALKQIALEFSQYRNKVHLVLGSNQIITKLMEIPPMREQQVLRIVEKELKNFHNNPGDIVYDYSVIRKRNADNKGGMILAAAAEKKMIEQYEELFKECGMKLQSIDIALDALIKMTSFIPELKEKTYIISVFSGRNMMSSLFVDGVYTYTSRIRLISERHSPDMIKEVVQDISSIIQLHRAQKNFIPIEAVYFCGLEEDEQANICKGVQGQINIKTQMMPDSPGICYSEKTTGYHLNQFVYSTGNLFGK